MDCPRTLGFGLSQTLSELLEVNLKPEGILRWPQVDTIELHSPRTAPASHVSTFATIPHLQTVWRHRLEGLHPREAIYSSRCPPKLSCSATLN